MLYVLPTCYALSSEIIASEQQPALALHWAGLGKGRMFVMDLAYIIDRNILTMIWKIYFQARIKTILIESWGKKSQTTYS